MWRAGVGVVMVELQEARIEVGGVPARLYRPDGASGLILLGHRGTQGKDHPRFVELGRLYARGTGLAVACIDAPAHGERSPATGDPDKDFEIVVSTVTGPQDITVPDWQAVAGELTSIGPPRAYVGFSMGAMLGLAVIAAFPSIAAGVLWVAGLPPAPAVPQPAEPNAFVAGAQASGRAQILMVNMAGDELMGPREALGLFELIGGERKRLVFYPGDHGTEPEEAMQLSIEFLSRHAGAHS